jgi:hypothetical protein
MDVERYRLWLLLAGVLKRADSLHFWIVESLKRNRAFFYQHAIKVVVVLARCSCISQSFDLRGILLSVKLADL